MLKLKHEVGNGLLLYVMKADVVQAVAIYKVFKDQTNLRAEVKHIVLVDLKDQKDKPMKLLLKAFNRMTGRRKLSHIFWFATQQEQVMSILQGWLNYD